MHISKNSVVAIDYKLTIEGGIIVDASEKGAPLVYLHGIGNLIPGLEKALEGLEAGAEKKVVVEAKDGYGEYEDEKVREVPKTQFPDDATFQVGDRVTAHSPDGQAIEARIKLISPENVTLDFNPELAGKTLNFDVKVVEVRAASKEELAHGHVHGPGGHQH